MDLAKIVDLSTGSNEPGRPLLDRYEGYRKFERFMTLTRIGVEDTMEPPDGVKFTRILADPVTVGRHKHVRLVEATAKFMQFAIFLPLAKNVSRPDVLVVAVNVSTKPLGALRYSAAVTETVSNPGV